MSSLTLVLASLCLVQSAFCWIAEPAWAGYGAEFAPGPYMSSPYGPGAFGAPLLEAPLAGPFGSYAAPLLEAPFAAPFAAPYAAPLLEAPFAAPYAVPYAAPYEAFGAYGGEGIGDVAVAGEMPVAGTTLVTGQVPILGAVRFAGDLPAGGVVSIAGSCGCGRAPYMY